MTGKYRKIVTDVRIEMAEVEVADKEGADVRARACLLHAKEIIETFLRKENEDGKNS